MPVHKIAKLIGRLQVAKGFGDQSGRFLVIQTLDRYALRQVLATQVSQCGLQRMLWTHVNISIGSQHENATAPGLTSQVLYKLETGAINPVEIVKQQRHRP